MRKVRITHKNALHHVMNRGIKKENIFPEDSDKIFFINLIRKFSKKYGIEIFAFVILNNHYHIILKNLNNNLSLFMMELNGCYGRYYRIKYGGKGYVFQNRFKSTIIENINYLRICIIYLFLNPLRKGLCANPFLYEFSSLHYSLNKNTKNDICDLSLMVEIFSSYENLKAVLMKFSSGNEFSLKPNNKINEYIGNTKTIEKALRRFNRRVSSSRVPFRRRKTDKTRMSISESIELVQTRLGFKLHNLSLKNDMRKVKKAIRILREECLLRYNEINLVFPFSQLKYDNLTKYLRRKEK